MILKIAIKITMVNAVRIEMGSAQYLSEYKGFFCVSVSRAGLGNDILQFFRLEEDLRIWCLRRGNLRRFFSPLKPIFIKKEHFLQGIKLEDKEGAARRERRLQACFQISLCAKLCLWR